MQRKAIKSSNLAEVGHEASLDILEVQFLNGAIWQYHGVTVQTYNEMMAAPSIGSFFARKIKGQYREEKIADKTPTPTPAKDELPKIVSVGDEHVIEIELATITQPAPQIFELPLVRRFVAKPVAIEAMQFASVESAQEIIAWGAQYGIEIQLKGVQLLVPQCATGSFYMVTKANVGDWVMKHRENFFLAMEADVVAQSYDEVICV
jgi:hypothetical protein